MSSSSLLLTTRTRSFVFPPPPLSLSSSGSLINAARYSSQQIPSATAASFQSMQRSQLQNLERLPGPSTQRILSRCVMVRSDRRPGRQSERVIPAGLAARLASISRRARRQLGARNKRARAAPTMRWSAIVRSAAHLIFRRSRWQRTRTRHAYCGPAPRQR